MFVANMATLLARQGHRVGILDTDLQFPGVYTWFGLDADTLDRTLTEYLWAQKPIIATAYALHERDDAERPFLKQTLLWLVPGVKSVGDSAKLLRESYDVSLLQLGMNGLVKSLALDYLIIDTYPGVYDEALLLIALSDTLVLLMSMDQQSFYGTRAMVEVAHKLDVPKVRLVVNQVPLSLNFAEVKQRYSATYNLPVAGLLPYSPEVAGIGSTNVFSALYPDHAWTTALRELIADVIDAAE
jgi:septum site-determining protein MinD